VLPGQFRLIGGSGGWFRNERIVMTTEFDYLLNAMESAGHSPEPFQVRYTRAHAALRALWGWTEAEIEHHGGAMPDDFIVELVRTALTPNAELTGIAR